MRPSRPRFRRRGFLGTRRPVPWIPVLGAGEGKSERVKAVEKIGESAADPSVPMTLAFVHTLEGGEREFSFCRNPGADMMLDISEIDPAIVTTRKGAIRAMPDREQIEQLLKESRTV